MKGYTYGLNGSGHYYGLICLGIEFGKQLLVKISGVELKINVRPLILGQRRRERERRNFCKSC
jgi:hypothetical protein